MQLLPSLHVGGVETGVVDLTTELKAMGHEGLVASAGATPTKPSSHEKDATQRICPVVSRRSAGRAARRAPLQESVSCPPRPYLGARLRVPCLGSPARPIIRPLGSSLVLAHAYPCHRPMTGAGSQSAALVRSAATPKGRPRTRPQSVPRAQRAHRVHAHAADPRRSTRALPPWWISFGANDDAGARTPLN